MATKWCFLKSSKLEAICVANLGYTEGNVHFSLRVVRSMRAGKPDGSQVDLQALLKSYAAKDSTLEQRIGPNFAQGHKEASGGIMSRECWDDFVKAMEVGVKDLSKPSPKKSSKVPQKSNLHNFFWLGQPGEANPCERK